MTKDDILDAAAQIFSQKGFHATSMQDIAEAVNLQKSSLYYHINSKQGMLVAILDRALDLLIEQMQAVIDKKLPADEKLRLAVVVYMRSMAENHDLAAVLLLEHRSLEASYQAHHIPRRDKFESLWRDLVGQGVEEGLFCETDLFLAARALLGVMNWTITWYRPDGPLPIEEIARQFADLFLSGLLDRSQPVTFSHKPRPD